MKTADLSGWIIRSCYHSTLPFKAILFSCRWGKWGACRRQEEYGSSESNSKGLHMCIPIWDSRISLLTLEPQSQASLHDNYKFGDLSMFEVVKKQNLPTGNWLTFYADTKQEILSIRFWGKDFLKRSFQCRSKSNWKEICSGWVF